MISLHINGVQQKKKKNHKKCECYAKFHDAAPEQTARSHAERVQK